MIEITAEIRAFIDKAAAGAELAEDEYIDLSDGLIHCKKCGGQRQTVVPCFGKSGYFMPRCICQCQQEAEEQRKATEERQRRMERMSSVSLPQELIDAINNVAFWDSIPLWAVTLIGGLLITVLSFTMILTVYGRMFSLWMYAAIAPIPLSTFAGEPTSSVGKNFIRSYAGVCLQGVVIALSCIIFSAISSSPPAVDTGASVVTAVWTYVGELAFNLLVLVGAIKGCDRIVKEIMGL